MEKTNLLALVVTLTVGIILAGSLLVPVINGVTDDIVVTNNFGHRATLIDDASSYEDTLTISLTYATPSITINGESIEGEVGEWFEILVTDEIAFHYQWGTPATISFTVYSTSQSKGIIEVLTTDLDITISGTTVTYEYSTFSITRTISWFSYMDSEGDHINALMYSGFPKTTAYVSNIDDIRGYTINGTFTKTFAFVGDTVKVNKVNGSGTAADLTATCSLSDYSRTSEIKTFEVGRGVGSYDIDDNGTTTHPFSYVLPYQLSAKNVMTDYSALLLAIPVLIIIGLVLFAAMAISRRD